MNPCDAILRSMLQQAFLLQQQASLLQQQTSPEAVDVGGAAWRLLLILLVLVGLLFVVARYGRGWLARFARTPPGELTVRAVCPLEPRRTLYLVRLRDREYLIAASEAGLSLVRELAAPTVQGDAARPGASAGTDDRQATETAATTPGDGP